MHVFVSRLNLSKWKYGLPTLVMLTYTGEKDYIIAGHYFGDQAGHTLIVMSALYGRKSSGIYLCERFSTVLCKMGFMSSKADNDI